MTKLEIEKNIPMPAKKNWDEYPLGELRVTDSFFIKRGDHKDARRVRSFITGYKYRRGAGKDFMVRTVSGGVRVWRVPG